MLRELVYAVAGFLLLLYAADRAFSLRDDSKEPPRIWSRAPLIGHALGLARWGNNGYFNILGKRTALEIYTVGVFSLKIYICSTLRLLPVIQRNSKTLSFRPFTAITSKVMASASDEVVEMMGTNFVDPYHKAMRDTLLPGPDLDQQNARMANQVICELDNLAKDTGAGGTADIFLVAWARHLVVQASSCGVFGVNHPYRDPEIEKAFWTWEHYLPKHFAGTDFFGTGYAAREKMFAAFRQYTANLPSDASLLIKETHRVYEEAGWPFEDIVRHHAIFSNGVFANTSPTLYWTIYELFSRPLILEEVRQEVLSHAVHGTQETGFVLDTTAVKTRCALLLSVLQESQRTRHIHANIRKVMDDTILDGRYLLKKGSFLQMPGAPIHHNTEVWGPTAAQFDPYRFVKKTAHGQREPVSVKGFLAWGAPPHLCPARQFAATEILLAVALLVTRFDLEPVDGPWEGGPALDVGNNIATMWDIRKDVKLRVRRRDALAGKWSLASSGSKTRVPIASG